MPFRQKLWKKTVEKRRLKTMVKKRRRRRIEMDFRIVRILKDGKKNLSFFP